jgi:hypothetical protein
MFLVAFFFGKPQIHWPLSAACGERVAQRAPWTGRRRASIFTLSVYARIEQGYK